MLAMLLLFEYLFCVALASHSSSLTIEGVNEIFEIGVEVSTTKISARILTSVCV